MQKRILVIDDCRLTRVITRDLLEEAGYEVVTAECALTANPLIETPPPPDLILMDVVMPEVSGGRKVRRLKVREPSRAIPVVLISTKPREELRQLANRSGADGFLQKPLSRALLLQELERLFTAPERIAAGGLTTARKSHGFLEILSVYRGRFLPPPRSFDERVRTHGPQEYRT